MPTVEHKDEHAEELDRQLPLKFETHASPFPSADLFFTVRAQTG
jgi:hypothetical protein